MRYSIMTLKSPMRRKSKDSKKLRKSSYKLYEARRVNGGAISGDPYFVALKRVPVKNFKRKKTI